LKAKALTCCFLALAVGAFSACGKSKKAAVTPTTTGGANTIDIYSSLPLKGATSAQTVPMVNGIRLALAQAHGKAGRFKVNYISLDDSTTTSPTIYDLNVCQQNARRAATDPKAVYYIGEFNSGCSKVVIPILNEAGVPQVSPANTYVGLTTNEPGSAPGEPQKYYPTGKRNYLRLVPRDKIQGAAGLAAMKADGCTRVAVNNDKTPYGAGLAAQLDLQKARYGLTITSDTPLDATSPNFRAYASTVKAQGANCVYTAFNPTGEVELVKDIHAALPTAKIYGGDGICTASVTNPAKGGFPKSIAPFYKCTQAALGLTAQPGGVSPFLPAYQKAYGPGIPDPYSIYGYEAMKLGLATIASLGPNGNNRADVLAALFAIRARKSVIGTYGFDKNGDTTLTSYGLYKVGADGNVAFARALKG
jgi:branched-chain amino acid transport system substrate-binding protein